MIRVKGIHQGYVLSVHATSMFYKNRHDNPISVILKPVRSNSIFWKFKFQCMLRFVIFKRHHPSLSVHDWLGCVKLYEKPQFKDIEYLNSNNHRWKMDLLWMDMLHIYLDENICRGYRL